MTGAHDDALWRSHSRGLLLLLLPSKFGGAIDENRTKPGHTGLPNPKSTPLRAIDENDDCGGGGGRFKNNSRPKPA